MMDSLLIPLHQQLTLPLDRWSLAPAAEADDEEDSISGRTASRDLRLFCAHPKRRGLLLGGTHLPYRLHVLGRVCWNLCDLYALYVEFPPNLVQGQGVDYTALGGTYHEYHWRKPFVWGLYSGTFLSPEKSGKICKP